MVGLIEGLRRSAREFRLGAEAAGGEAFAEFIGALTTELGRAQGALEPKRLLPILQRALEAQERSDFVALADVLEYELLPLLAAPVGGDTKG